MRIPSGGSEWRLTISKSLLPMARNPSPLSSLFIRPAQGSHCRTVKTRFARCRGSRWIPPSIFLR
jgi:hypothetical protein